MAISLSSPSPPSPPPPPRRPPQSSSSPCSPPPSWLARFFFDRGVSFASDNPIAANNLKNNRALESTEYQEDGLTKVGEVKAATTSTTNTTRLRKRPGKLIVPEYSPGSEFGGEMKNKRTDDESEEFEVVEGRDYYVASKKGRREAMEDGYGVLLDVLGDPKQAFFAVIDGHGGRAATDYVAENLGKNIVKALEFTREEEEEDRLDVAIHGGYLATDEEFLSQGVNGGACAASVLFSDGNVHVANVGDCRVVLSRNGLAHVLTREHRLSREDERLRIESSGGFVHCRNGVWRVNGSLAVSRAIGDQHLKQWVISEPDIYNIPLTSDCDFLIMASDGLWDKVNDQEAVDMVSRGKNSQESCRKLVDMSLTRGNRDDITVMVINVQQFVANSTS